MSLGTVLAILCPGQGSQSPGFLAPWLELAGVAAHLDLLGESAQVDLIAHGTVSDAATIQDTAVAQPLIVASGLAVLRVLFPGAEHALVDGGRVNAVAGHSVGEITAAAAVGVLAERDAMTLVRERGRAMAAASAATPTGMSAVLGGDPAEVSAALEQHGLTAANVNGAGQVIAAGTAGQLAALAAAPPAKARVVALKVAGAFHTAHMAPALESMRTCAARISPRDPVTRLLSNADGAVVTSGAEVLSRLVVQVSNPVRWDLCSATLADLGVTALLEIPPAGTLVNLAKRGLPGVEVLALKTPADLDAARTMILKHADVG